MPFYNRVNETKIISEKINSTTIDNKLLIISGMTGVGKSSLVKEILNNHIKDKRFATINICKASSENIESLYFFNQIYKKIWRTGEYKKTLSKPLFANIFNRRNLSYLLFEILKSKLGLGKVEVFEPIDDIEILRKKEYIIKLLNKNKLILCVDNIQDVDTQSLELILDIIKNTNNCIFIFEYTTVKGDHFLFDFFNQLNNISKKAYLFEIEKLDFQEAKKIVPSGAAINDRLLKTIYNNSNGNLIKMILANNILLPQDDPIACTLNSLSKNEKYIVNIIYLYGGEISTIDLGSITIELAEGSFPISVVTLSKIINNLVANNILSQKGLFVQIKHDSIISELEHQQPNSILFIAYKNLKNFLINKVNSSCELNEEATERLFALYLKFDDEELVELIPKLKKKILYYKYPEQTIEKLSIFKDSMLRRCDNFDQDSGIYKLVLMLVEVCYYLKLHRQAQENLNIIFNPECPYHIALQAGIWSINLDDINIVNNFDAQICNIVENSRLKLVVELCQLNRMMYLSTQKARTYAENIISNTEYKKHLEYGFVLRNYTDLIYDIDERIRIFMCCKEFFTEKGMDVLVRQIDFDLATCFVEKGNTIKAKQLIESASKYSMIKLAYLLNNLSVINIIEGDYSTKVLSNLSNALLVTNDKYEKIIIMCHILIYYIKAGQNKHAEQICVSIIESGFEEFTEEFFLLNVYSNLIFYFSETKDFKMVSYYKHLYESIDVEIELSNKVNNSYLSNFPFRVDFLGYWEFDILTDL